MMHTPRCCRVPRRSSPRWRISWPARCASSFSRPRSSSPAARTTRSELASWLTSATAPELAMNPTHVPALWHPLVGRAAPKSRLGSMLRTCRECAHGILGRGHPRVDTLPQPRPSSGESRCHRIPFLRMAFRGTAARTTRAVEPSSAPPPAVARPRVPPVDRGTTFTNPVDEDSRRFTARTMASGIPMAGHGHRDKFGAQRCR